VTPNRERSACYEMSKRATDLGPVADPCEHGNEISGSINGGEFID